MAFVRPPPPMHTFFVCPVPSVQQLWVQPTLHCIHCTYSKLFALCILAFLFRFHGTPPPPGLSMTEHSTSASTGRTVDARCRTLQS